MGRELPDAERCVVTLRRNSDGKTVSFLHGYPDGAEFWWTDGNGGCNCNRWLAFMDASGEEYDPEDATCAGDENDGPRFTLVSIVTDGVLVVDDECITDAGEANLARERERE